MGVRKDVEVASATAMAKARGSAPICCAAVMAMGAMTRGVADPPGMNCVKIAVTTKNPASNAQGPKRSSAVARYWAIISAAPVLVRARPMDNMPPTSTTDRHSMAA